MKNRTGIFLLDIKSFYGSATKATISNNLKFYLNLLATVKKFVRRKQFHSDYCENVIKKQEGNN